MILHKFLGQSLSGSWQHVKNQVSIPKKHTATRGNLFLMEEIIITALTLENVSLYSFGPSYSKGR